MQFLRRSGTPFIAISLLIGLSVLTVISVGEGFKLFVSGKDGVKLRKRDGSTITFDLPWNPPKLKPETEVKALNPVVGGILNAVQAVASALLDDGTDIANNALAQASVITATIVPIASNAASSALGGGVTQVPSAVGSVTSAVNQATAVVGGIVSAANSIVASIVGGAASPSNTSMLSASAPLSISKSGILGNGLPSSTNGSNGALSQIGLCSTCNNSHSSTALPLNITSALLLSSMTWKSVLPLAPSGTSIPTCTSCPAAITETCTVTETWHSTHYAETATLFSFVAAFTVTCTETVSVCPSPTAYLPPANVTLPPPPPLVACANGVLAKRQEDCPQTANSPANSSFTSLYPAATENPSHPCPNAGYSCSECPNAWFCPPSQTAPQSAPCGFGWACGACSGGWFCIPSPTSAGGAGLVNSAADVLSSVPISLTSAMPSTMASFTAQPPSFSSTIPTAPATTRARSITCIDGSVVQRSQDCLNGISGASSTLQAFGTFASSVLIQATGLVGSAVGGEESALNPAISEVSSALAQVSGLSGGLLSTIMANLASALRAANGLASNVQPTPASLVGNVAGTLLPNSGPLAGNLQPTVASLVGNAAGNILSTVAALAGGSILQGTGVVNTLAGNVNNLGDGIAPTATAVVGNVVGNLPGLFKEVKQGANTISHITTIVNGQPSTLPVILTVLNGVATSVPVIHTTVNGIPIDLSVLDGGLGELAQLLGRAAPKQDELEA